MAASAFDAISISENIVQRQTTLLQFVESLEEKFTSATVNQREEGIRQLTEVLQLIPNDFLDELEVSTMVRFFSVRLSDSILLTTSCLNALSYLSHCKKFPTNGEQTILNSIFKEHIVQSLVQNDRFTVFSLIQYFLDIRLEGLKTLDTEFVLGFIQASDGEKDPRNLMLIFDCFVKIATNFQLGPFVEDMFELVACYFPVDFKRPLDDPYSITSEQLSVALECCLTCHKEFGRFAYQLIDEKFDEDKPEERQAVLKFLRKSLTSFPFIVTDEFSNVIWKHLSKITTISSKNQGEIERLALECLKNLIVSMSKLGTSDGRNSNLVSLLGRISQECEHYLSNVEMQLYDVGHKVLVCCAEADENVCNRLATKVLPLLMEKYQSTKHPVKLNFAKFLLDWVEVVRKVPLSTVKNSFSAIICDDMLQLSTDKSLLSIGLKIVSTVVQLDSTFFTEEQLNKVLVICVRQVEEEDVDEDKLLRKTTISVLRTLINTHREFVRNNLETVTNDNYSTMLNAYAVLIVDETTGEWFLKKILDFSTPTTRNLICLKLFVDENRQNENVLTVFWRPLCEKLFNTDFRTFVSTVGNLLQDLIVCLNSKSEFEMMEFCMNKLNGSLNDECHVLIMEKLIGGLSETNVEKFLPQLHIESGVQYVTNFDQGDHSFDIATSWAKILAILLNKLPQSSSMMVFLIDKYVSLLQLQVTQEISSVPLTFFGYLTKALLLRYFAPLCNNCLSQIFDLLNTGRSESAENALEIVYLDDERFLSTKTKAKLTFLHKQRVFTQFVDLLTKNFRLVEKSAWKRNYFKILSVLLANTPRELQSPSEIEKLTPLLISSIQSDDVEILSPSVNSVELLLNTTTAVEKLHPHIRSLLQRLCKLANDKENKMELRIASLKCLSKVPTCVNSSILSPWRAETLKYLSLCLDDPKRLVRREAVGCRNKWFLMV